MNPPQLASTIQQVPRRPGIYRFLDASGKSLYVGKATNLKSRLNSYHKTSDSRIQKMLELARRLVWQATDSDIEALILESQLIKKHHPPFNVTMRDDKQYAYVAFSRGTYPRIWITHQKREPADYIGPFTETGALRETLKYLRRLFPYCTCKQLHHVRCLNAHIGKCFGDCCLKEQSHVQSEKLKIKSQYQKNIRAIRDILSGKRTVVIKRLEKEMDTLARKEDFQEAIALRGKIERIKRIFENAGVIKNLPNTSDGSEELAQALKLSVIPVRIEGYDISNIQGMHATGSMVLFRHGQPDKNGYRKFKIRTVAGSNDTAMLQEVLTRRFRHTEWYAPDLVILDGGRGQLNTAMTALAKSKKLKAEHTSIIALTKNSRHQPEKITYRTVSAFKEIKMSRLPEDAKNLVIRVDAEAHRFAIQYYRKLHRSALQ